MAIAPTGDIFKGFEFDGQSSKNYGIYITGQAVYNAPVREAEMIAIPGRNGAFALDKGRFENIEVTYPAGIYADSETDFAEAISDFRNFLCSRNGYVRLTDEYNPNEYRMAIYKSGLEVSPAQLKAGEFNIVFDCKPQRWLTSGETEVAIADGESITNPTLFESSPLLAVKGYGTIGFNNYAIEIDNTLLGDITIAKAYNKLNSGTTLDADLDVSMLNASDAIFISNVSMSIPWERDAPFVGGVLYAAPVITPASTYPDEIVASCAVSFVGNAGIKMTPIIQNIPFVYGTPASYAFTIDVEIDTYSGGGFNLEATAHPSISVAYDGDSAVTITASPSVTGTGASRYTRGNISASYSDIIGNSSKSVLGNPTYIDCDLGEAYRIEGGTYISLNKSIDLGSDLPKLASGSNTVAIDNTITELKITPRWWKV